MLKINTLIKQIVAYPRDFARFLSTLPVAVRSWIWWLTEYPEGTPPYCPHVNRRMVCDFCSNHVVEENQTSITTYCRIVSKLRAEGILK